MTDRLYHADPDLLAFDATVLATRVHGGRPAAVLDRTAFYPEGGGQPADRGRLGGVAVVDVQEVGDEILHFTEGPPPSGHVRGEVDAARRLDHVQQHHGQHLLSAAFEGRAGARTLSFHLGADTCTLDLDAPPAALGPEVLRAVESAANAFVFRDLPVVARDLSPDELARLPLRKEPAKGSRVVVVGEPGPGGGLPATDALVDASPCGGTHPRRTGVVGAIAVLRVQKWGAGTRVEFLCGGRVVRALAEASARLQAAADAFRCASAEVPAAAARTVEEAAVRRKDQEKLVAALADAEAARLAAREGAIAGMLAPPVPGAAAWARAVAQALAVRGRVACLGAVEDGRVHLAFARPRGADGPHMGERLRAAAASLGGKGGGAPDFAQGSAPAADGLEAVLESAARLG
ncbi:alanyl-tRNA editing protein [Anaeromyxobacter oryzae]|uniref:Alanyl-tRNA editing protein n=1 Tax=Anaeromyxobacter oryzae TaxID=2918170 RepID=A0ABN6MQQ8_9BACT|nr:DHHA1 domain-containing protein [Anaeromyxobacter oryzae]BDG03347.1 alanyl-tRNA editing protein [Anaeromyxobacter oryzae]